jgi:hypothetical protein
MLSPSSGLKSQWDWYKWPVIYEARTGAASEPLELMALT